MTNVFKYLIGHHELEGFSCSVWFPAEKLGSENRYRVKIRKTSVYEKIYTEHK